jgi:MYXO-CTERM domain-containing protein
MTTRTALALAVTAGVASIAQADVIAYWNFNDNVIGVGSAMGYLNPGAYNANQGFGTLTVDPSITINSNNTVNNGTFGTFAGTTVNAISPDPSGGSIVLQNGSGGVNNGKYVQFNISTLSVASNLILSYATRKTNTGFATQTISYSVDGGPFVTLGGVAPATSFGATSTLAFGAADVYGKASLAVRFTFSGGSTGANDAAGNNRIDNVQFNGTVPTPGAMALLGLGGLVAGRRRR